MIIVRYESKSRNGFLYKLAARYCGSYLILWFIELREQCEMVLRNTSIVVNATPHGSLCHTLRDAVAKEKQVHIRTGLLFDTLNVC